MKLRRCFVIILLIISIQDCVTESQHSALTLSYKGKVGAVPGDFDFYVYSLSWTPSFCNDDHCDLQQCQELTGTYAETNLSIHGLWPQYRLPESQGGFSYPMFCNASCRGSSKKSSSECMANIELLRPLSDYYQYAPGYVKDDNKLAKHEWLKHGTCSGLSQEEYFSSTMTIYKSHKEGLHYDILSNQQGKTLSKHEIVAAFVGTNTVALRCLDDETGQSVLQELRTCWSKDNRGFPMSQMACPVHVLASSSSCSNNIFIPFNNCSNGNYDVSVKSAISTSSLLIVLDYFLLTVFLIWAWSMRKKRQIHREIYASEFPKREEEMKTGLLDCFSRPDVCVPVSLAPGAVNALNIAEVEGRRCHCCDLIPASFLGTSSYWNRQAIKSKYGIRPNNAIDCMESYICSGCAIGRNYLELEKRGDMDCRSVSTHPFSAQFKSLEERDTLTTNRNATQNVHTTTPLSMTSMNV